MNITSFVRVLEKQGYSGWKEKLAKMGGLFAEAEYQMVQQGYRRAAIIHIGENDYKEMTDKMNRDGLIFTPFLKSGYYKGFSHQHKPVRPGDRYFWYGSLTKSYKDGQEFKKANEISDHLAYGEFLGYPKCCANYFNDNFSKNYDPIWLELEGEVTGYPEANPLIRYFGVRITSHFSCSPTCEETRKVGQDWLSVMRGIDPDLTNELYDLLSQKMRWSSYHGVVEVETPYFVGVTHTHPLIEKSRNIKWTVKKDNKDN